VIPTGEEQQRNPGYISSLISQAYQRIRDHITQTRLVYDPTYSLWLKCENEQKTGSFKWRGALSKLSLFAPGQSIITASTGNHGLGVANAAVLFGLKARIFLPATASPKKIEKLKALGADLVHVDGDSLDAEIQGKEYAALHQLPWVSPYNDESIIAGQGTIGLEISERLQEIDKIYITVGGGGLISGIGSWIRNQHPNAEIIGCQPVNSPEMYLSILADHVVTAPESLPTLSDGSAGPLEEDSITFPICQDVIDRFILVSEEEIEIAIRQLYNQHHLVVEGAAGVAMAAAMKDIQRQSGDTSVVILCGGNIDATVHEKICKSVRT
jgi:threonine dehydratase